MPTPRDCMMVTIARWEGLYGADPQDPGNWIEGRNVGTMRGVTPGAAQAYFKVPASQIDEDFMRSRVTLEVAGDIALAKFYKGWIDPLTWCAPADVVTDFGWGSGPGQAVKSTERALGVSNPDFAFDPASIGLWAARLDSDGVVKMLWWVHDWRQAFYDLICRVNPVLLKYRLGWSNRARWQTPESKEWWSHWQGETTGVVTQAAEVIPIDNVPRGLLTRGMRGSEVRRLQLALIAKGYPLPKFGADGDFGGETDEAVRKVQTKYDLKVDGWVGPATRAVLEIVT